MAGKPKRKLRAMMMHLKSDATLLEQFDFWACLWSNRRFIVAAGVIFLSGAILAIASNTPHREITIMSRDVGSAMTVPIKPNELLKAIEGDISFTRIATHNIQAGIHMLILGISFGVGTLILLALNGAAVGCMLLMVLNAPSSFVLAASIFAHAPIEVAGLLLCGAAGLRLGYGLGKSVTSSSIWQLQFAALEALYIGCASVAALTISSLVEAFISFSPNVPAAYKMAVGVFSILALLALLRLSQIRWVERELSK